MWQHSTHGSRFVPARGRIVAYVGDHGTVRGQLPDGTWLDAYIHRGYVLPKLPPDFNLFVGMDLEYEHHVGYNSPQAYAYNVRILSPAPWGPPPPAPAAPPPRPAPQAPPGPAAAPRTRGLPGTAVEPPPPQAHPSGPAAVAFPRPPEPPAQQALPLSRAPASAAGTQPPSQPLPPPPPLPAAGYRTGRWDQGPQACQPGAENRAPQPGQRSLAPGLPQQQPQRQRQGRRWGPPVSAASAPNAFAPPAAPLAHHNALQPQPKRGSAPTSTGTAATVSSTTGAFAALQISAAGGSGKGAGKGGHGPAAPSSGPGRPVPHRNALMGGPPPPAPADGVGAVWAGAGRTGVPKGNQTARGWWPPAEAWPPRRDGAPPPAAAPMVLAASNGALPAPLPPTEALRPPLPLSPPPPLPPGPPPLPSPYPLAPGHVHPAAPSAARAQPSAAPRAAHPPGPQQQPGMTHIKHGAGQPMSSKAAHGDRGEDGRRHERHGKEGCRRGRSRKQGRRRGPARSGDRGRPPGRSPSASPVRRRSRSRSRSHLDPHRNTGLGPHPNRQGRKGQQSAAGTGVSPPAGHCAGGKAGSKPGLGYVAASGPGPHGAAPGNAGPRVAPGWAQPAVAPYFVRGLDAAPPPPARPHPQGGATAGYPPPPRPAGEGAQPPRGQAPPARAELDGGGALPGGRGSDSDALGIRSQGHGGMQGPAGHPPPMHSGYGGVEPRTAHQAGDGGRGRQDSKGAQRSAQGCGGRRGESRRRSILAGGSRDRGGEQGGGMGPRVGLAVSSSHHRAAAVASASVRLWRRRSLALADVLPPPPPGTPPPSAFAPLGATFAPPPPPPPAPQGGQPPPAASGPGGPGPSGNTRAAPPPPDPRYVGAPASPGPAPARVGAAAATITSPFARAAAARATPSKAAVAARRMTQGPKAHNRRRSVGMLVAAGARALAVSAAVAGLSGSAANAGSAGLDDDMEVEAVARTSKPTAIGRGGQRGQGQGRKQGGRKRAGVGAAGPKGASEAEAGAEARAMAELEAALAQVALAEGPVEGTIPMRLFCGHCGKEQTWDVAGERAKPLPDAAADDGFKRTKDGSRVLYDARGSTCSHCGNMIMVNPLSAVCSYCDTTLQGFRPTYWKCSNTDGTARRRPTAASAAASKTAAAAAAPAAPTAPAAGDGGSSPAAPPSTDAAAAAAVPAPPTGPGPCEYSRTCSMCVSYDLRYGGKPKCRCPRFHGAIAGQVTGNKAGHMGWTMVH